MDNNQNSGKRALSISDRQNKFRKKHKDEELYQVRKSASDAKSRLKTLVRRVSDPQFDQEIKAKAAEKKRRQRDKKRIENNITITADMGESVDVTLVSADGIQSGHTELSSEQPALPSEYESTRNTIENEKCDSADVTLVSEDGHLSGLTESSTQQPGPS